MTFNSTSTLKVSTLQLETLSSYKENLFELLSIIKSSDSQLIVAPELVLTNFDYKNFNLVADFYDIALKRILELVGNKIVVLTLVKKEKEDFYNEAVVIHQQQIVHRQNKYKLFTLGDEQKYFKAGKEDEIVSFEIDSIKYGILICFELRFKELWQRLEGVDVIIVPARWGKNRKEHLETLSKALAIINQCFVVVSNSSDEDMASSSAIISPWGKRFNNDTLKIIEEEIKLKDVQKVRRLIKIQ